MLTFTPHFKVKLSYKLFAAFYIIMLIILAFMVFMTRHIVIKDFEASVNTLQLSHVEKLVAKIKNEYRQRQNLVRLTELSDDNWGAFVAPNAPPPPGIDNALPRHPRPKGKLAPPHLQQRNAPPLAKGPPPGGKGDPLGISSRISLYDSKDRLIAGVNIPEHDQILKQKIEIDGKLIGWLVIQEARDLDNPTNTRFLALLTKALFLAGSISLIFSTLASIMLSRHILAPIKQLAKGARALASQKLTTRLNVIRTDEFGELASVFNVMAEQLEIMTERIKEASLVDPLTGLKNRRFLYEAVLPEAASLSEKMIFHLEHGKEKRWQKDDYFGILVFDIDHFKDINDKYGHDAGDRVLKQFSLILTNAVRKADVVIRLGGEEFLVVLKNVADKSAGSIANKIRHQIESKSFIFNEQGDVCRLTCSVGYVIFPFLKNDPELFELEEAIALADLALYYSKQHGRNLSVGIMPTEKAMSQEQKKSLLSSLEFGTENKFWEITIDE